MLRVLGAEKVKYGPVQTRPTVLVAMVRLVGWLPNGGVSLAKCGPLMLNFTTSKMLGLSMILDMGMCIVEPRPFTCAMQGCTCAHVCT